MNRDAVGAVGGGDGIATGCPATAVGQIAVLLQGVAAGVGPGNDDAVARMGDDQIRQAGRLHHGYQRPETTGQGIIPAHHRPARIRLANGAADGIYAAGARAAATGNFIPVD